MVRLEQYIKLFRSIFIIILALSAVFISAINYLNPLEESAVEITEQLSSQGLAKTEPNYNKADNKKPFINIVFLGFDRSASRMIKQDIFRPDTIIIVNANFHTSTVSLLSIPRDSYVEIHGADKRDKINHAYVHGYLNPEENQDAHDSGIRTTLSTIQDFLGGVVLDSYILIDMDGADHIIDGIGGLYYNVGDEVRSDFGMGEVSIEEGYQLLDGKKLMDYVRYRASHQGCVLKRVERQQSIIVALFEQFRNQGTFNDISDLFLAYDKIVETDLSLQQIVDLGVFANKLEPNNIKRYIFTGDGRYVNQEESSVWLLFTDEDEKSAIINKVFGE